MTEPLYYRYWSKGKVDNEGGGVYLVTKVGSTLNQISYQTKLSKQQSKSAVLFCIRKGRLLFATQVIE
ncbi:hypothetical protein AU255_13575 [Methyloprofundus sedimenti]|uniref:Uncharacterized protein n=1 Tax=Methyloprofundus sedimenti TaxID=1420851 RepID=A0A1V8M3I9_9GAMM|nr:hypothetical protein [Methyloprofundus sedimenti]OQK16130.1 hypothetical protein AU255_13575 [Methyloprofundus sedimenti]